MQTQVCNRNRSFLFEGQSEMSEPIELKDSWRQLMFNYVRANRELLGGR